jgi:hypothetical protein
MTGAGWRDSDHRSQIVTAAGAATTLVALAGVFALAHHGTNIMGWYGYYVIPAGALLVGAIAASGYGIAGWYTGLKMTRRLMWSVIGQLVVSYFIAQYEEYRHAVPGGEIGFWTYFDLSTRAFSFADHRGEPGTPFGVWGYAMRALEIGGYALCGWLVPAALGAKPYCDPCRTTPRRPPTARRSIASSRTTVRSPRRGPRTSRTRGSRCARSAARAAPRAFCQPRGSKATASK